MENRYEQFKEKMTKVIEDALRDESDYVIDWFNGTVFIDGLDRSTAISVKRAIENFTDVRLSQIGTEYGYDFC